MSVDTTKLKSRVLALSDSLDDLESILEPLLSQTLPETVINLEPLQQAKLQTDVPYVLYDLVFMYLKLKGIDPKAHPVIPELDRIRHYFEKISHTENPPTRKNEIDKAAVARFIKHAISSVKWTKTAAEEEDSEASSSRVPATITTKMFERAEYEKQLKEKAAAGEESEGEDLEVFDSAEMQVDAESALLAPSHPPPSETQKKRQRPAVDPFAGYGETNEQSSRMETDSRAAPKCFEPENTSIDSIPQPKHNKNKNEKLSGTSNTSEASKRKKKGKKKADS